ncbi:MAG: SGNH/GDSL hydrolase family protein [Verrucomicrobia bacterium]|nr:SGNH/GDSL hydrolase family protein [Verrucomicrobiota bacterium]
MKRFLLLSLCLLISDVQGEPHIYSGDRIAIIGNTFADQLRIHGYLETLLRQRLDISVRNLGWAGDMLTARDRPTGFTPEATTLTEHQTDLIIACFGMGESFAGEAGLPRFRSNLEAFIATHAGKKYNGESEVRLILVSPIATEDLGKLTPASEKRNGELEAYTGVMREVASNTNLPFVDLFKPSLDLMGDRDKIHLTVNGVTLNRLGYWAISNVFFEQLTGEIRQPWKLNIDANSLTGISDGVELSTIDTENNAISFSVTEQSTPSLQPPDHLVIPPKLEILRDTLMVNNLAVGEYTLSVDGIEIVTANHDQWAKGVAVDSTPSHRESEVLRDAIYDKNLQFTYGWKALNQVHIVGERKHSPSGRALPDELVEFYKLTEQREEDISKYRTRLPKKREWRLTPAK